MKEYTGCNKCKYDSKESNEFPCVECSHNRVVDYYEPKTNADRIRNFSDEDLAEFLDKSLNNDREDCDPIGCFGCAYYGTHHQDKDSEFYECGDCEFEGGLLEWLQAEVKEGAE